MGSRKFIPILAVPVVLTLVLPWILSGYLGYALCLTEANILAILGLNILMGYSGQISLGQAGFTAIGAYTTAILTSRLGFGFLPSMLFSMVFAGTIGWIMGWLVLRLKGPYLAVATLGFGAAVPEVIIQLTPLTGGSQGIHVSLPKIFGWTINNYVVLYYVLLIILIIVFFAVSNMFRTRFGREMRSVMDDEEVARAFGLNVAYFRITAFVLSSVLTGLAGSLQAYVIQYVSPDDYGFWTSIFYVAAVVIGGLGWLYGSILGAVFITILPLVTANLRGLVSVIFGICMLLVLLFLQPRRPMITSLLLRAIGSFVPDKNNELVGRTCDGPHDN